MRWVPTGPPPKPGGKREYVSWGAPDRTSLVAQNVVPVCCPHPHALPGPFTTGYIARDTFEEVTGGSMLAPYDHFSEAERRGELVRDSHPEEHATCYIVQGRGLVVISSCGHAGIVNSVKTAMAVSGVDRLHAVIGGFHLATAKPDYIEHTIDELERLAPDVVVPMPLHRPGLHRGHAPPDAGAPRGLESGLPLHLRRVAKESLKKPRSPGWASARRTTARMRWTTAALSSTGTPSTAAITVPLPPSVRPSSTPWATMARSSSGVWQSPGSPRLSASPATTP